MRTWRTAAALGATQTRLLQRAAMAWDLRRARQALSRWRRVAWKSARLTRALSTWMKRTVFRDQSASWTMWRAKVSDRRRVAMIAMRSMLDRRDSYFFSWCRYVLNFRAMVRASIKNYNAHLCKRAFTAWVHGAEVMRTERRHREQLLEAERRAEKEVKRKRAMTKMAAALRVRMVL